MTEISDLLLAAVRGAQPESTDVTRLATVTGGGGDSVLVRFDGETVASTRSYKRVATYFPQSGDRVLMIRVGSTWVVGGKIGQGQDFAPGVNVPNMPQTAWYSRCQRIGNRVDWECSWRVTATIGAGVPFWLGLPYPARGPSNDLPAIIGHFGARRTGVAYMTGHMIVRDSTTANFWNTSGTSVVHGTSPYAWGAGDDFWVTLSYFTTD